jgi:hypothetical protein
MNTPPAAVSPAPIAVPRSRGVCALWSVALLGLLAPGRATADERIDIYASSRLKHVPGGWSVLDILATNRTDAEGEATIVVSFPGGDGRQFARRVWLPARGERMTWLPVRIPAEVPAGRTTMPMSVITVEGGDGDERLSRSDGGTGFVSEDLLRISDEPVRTATYLDRQVLDDAALVSARFDQWTTTLTAARQAVQLSTNLSDLADDFLPPWPSALRGLDQILVASDRIATDTAGAAALRGWVRDGGRIWLALDAVRPETVALLLGDDCRLEVVDRVELDDFVIDGVREDGSPITERCTHDQPVDLVRVVTSHPDVVVRIGGWPAAIVVPYGQGEVVITALGPRGWLTPDRKQPTESLRTLAAKLFRLRPGRLDPGRLPRELEQRVGATVPRRALAAWVLGGFGAALVAVMALLFARGALAAIGVAVPLLAALATGAMLALARGRDAAVPAQIASAEVVRVAPRTAEANVDGLAAVYDTASRPVEWVGEQRHWTYPRAQRGTRAGRLLFRDDERLEISQTTTHASSIDRVWLGGTESLARGTARARFTAAGVTGRLEVGGYPPAADGADPFIVVSPSPAVAVRFAADGSFAAAPEDLLATDQYAAGTVLGDESIWRQEVVRTLLAIPGGAGEQGATPAPRVDPDAEPPPLQGRPWLCYWSSPDAEQWGLPDGFTRRWAALVVAELALDRTHGGERFRIPAPFLRPSLVAGQTGRSAAFDARTGRWVSGLSRPTETVLRFQLPSEVVPCRIDGARLEVRVSAPARTMTVAAVGAGGEAGTQSVTNPEGAYVLPFTADQLEPDAAWGLTFRIAIGESRRDGPPGDADVELTETWQIDHVHLTLDGTAD